MQVPVPEQEDAHHAELWDSNHGPLSMVQHGPSNACGGLAITRCVMDMERSPDWGPCQQPIVLAVFFPPVQPGPEPRFCRPWLRTHRPLAAGRGHGAAGGEPGLGECGNRTSHRFEAWAPNLGPCPLLPYLSGVFKYGPLFGIWCVNIYIYIYNVYNGYVSIPD